MTTHGDDVVLTKVEPKKGSLTAWAHEVGVIMCDGKITDVFEEDMRSIPRGPLRRGRVRTFIAYMSPFDLDYWLKDPHDPSEPEYGIVLDNLVLTSDGEPVTGRIGIKFSVMSGMVDLLLRLLGPRDQITKTDVAYTIERELQAKVMKLDLHEYTAADLRDDKALLRSIHTLLEGDLILILSSYGLQLDSFFITWGLTLEEREHIRRQRHVRSVQDAKRARELSDLRHHISTSAETSKIRAEVGTVAQRKRRSSEDQEWPPITAMGYWVYEDDPTSKARVHKGTCGYCNHGRGIRGSRLSDNRWIGPFETEEEAIDKALRTGRSDVRRCKSCLRTVDLSRV